MSKKVTRLFEQFAPEHYIINIAISEDKKTFTGSVTINGRKTGRPSERITLHAKDLKISDAKVIFTDKKGADKNIELPRINIQKTYEEVRLHAAETLYPGKYTISMNFSGTITKNMEGIYPSNFEIDGVKKQLIATQFESHHAREAFPCVDEPEAKATFDLSLTHAIDEMALGNTPIKSEVATGKQKTTTFDTTPVMSTYLVAFVTGEMAYKEAKSKSGVKIRTYSTENQIEHTAFALDVAVKSMDFYEDYYDIPFPLGKCDFVALPDFASGAMENWGLITFREQALLCDEEHTSLSTKQWVALVVAHELTHQWFGNLVTMRWWTDLWLNEGFASWMEYLAVDTLFPQWHLWTQFAVDEQQLALKIDGLEHTHPIEVTINHPDEIRTIFDAISYQKGASVIHMLHDYLGPEAFRDGLRHYLKTHSYKNTITIDLWQALEDVSNKPVKEFMHAWTSQSGYPIVDVSVKNDHLVVKQAKFVTNPTSKARNDATIWPVPLLTDGLDRDSADKTVNNIAFKGSDAPLQLNVGQTGFYRVDYSHDMQQRQLAAIDSGQFSAIDRMGLLSDGLEVTRAGYQSVTEYLDLLEHYRREDSLSTWEIMAGSIGTIRSTLSANDDDDTLRDAMKPFTRELVKNQLTALGWNKKESEPHLDTLLRPIIIGMAAAADDEPTTQEALKRYKAKMHDGGDIDADLRGIIYSTAARHGGQKEFEELLSAYKKSSSSDEKMSLTAAMTSFDQPKIHEQVLALITSDVVRLQDISYWIAYSFMNRHSRAASWDWMKENWQWLKENIGKDLSFSRTPIYAARNFADEKMIADYEAFFTKRMEPMLERSFNQGLEIAQTNAAWRKRDSAAALDWFTRSSK